MSKRVSQPARSQAGGQQLSQVKQACVSCCLVLLGDTVHIGQVQKEARVGKRQHLHRHAGDGESVSVFGVVLVLVVV